MVDPTKIAQLKARQDLDFTEAFYMLNNGFRLKRKAWKDFRYLELQKPDENSKMKRAYFFIVPLDFQPFPYTPTQLDLLMGDWQVVEA